MKKVLVLLAVCALFIGACSKDACLKKFGYSSCDHLKKALNLQDSDEALKYHSICKQCGCPECK